MKRFENSVNDIEKVIFDYNDMYEQLEKCIELEENSIDNFDISEIEKITEKKFVLFENFKHQLSDILNYEHYKDIPKNNRDSILNKAKKISDKIENNIFKIKAEMTFLMHFFNGVKEKSKKEKATYGVYSTQRKHSMQSLMYKEI